MARPFAYKKLDAILKSHDHFETISLGSTNMWGVKKGDHWVTISRYDTYGLNETSTQRKYNRLFFITKKSAERQCKKLNDLFNTDEYYIVKI